MLAVIALGGGVAVAGAWRLAMGVAAEAREEAVRQASARVLGAARAAREALPRALGPADRMLGQAQARQTALLRGDRREAEQIEHALLNVARRGQDGIRMVAVTDSAGSITFTSQPGALPGSVGHLEFFNVHRYGRVATTVARGPGPQAGLVVSRPLLGREGGFGGVAVVGLEASRLAQSLPASVGGDEPVLGLYLMDGTLLARGRGAGVMALPMQLDARLLPEVGGDRSLLHRDPRDGHAIVTATAQVAGQDMVVAASLDDSAGALTAQRSASAGYGAAGAATLLWLGLLGYAGWRLRRDPPAAPAAPRPQPAHHPAEGLPMHGRSALLVPQVVQAMPSASYAAMVREDGEVRITAVSPGVERITGWPPGVFQDLDRWQRNIDWTSYPPGQPLPERLLLEPEAEAEYRLRRADGAWIWLRENCRVVARDATGVEVLGVLADVTREHDLAHQAEQAARAATQGIVAAGLAHDLKQPLQVISYAAQNGLEALASGDSTEEVRERLLRVVSQSERAAAIARQLGDFTRLDATRLEPVALAGAVRGAMAEVAQALQEAGVEVQLRLAENLPPVRGKALMVEQVLVNLCLNARDAMLARPAGERRLRLAALYRADTDQVELTVADTGGGIAPELLQRVFEMHFTTKERGKGTGVGLTLCRMLMGRFGGSIVLRNVPGGAEARLVFRRAALPVSPNPDVAPPPGDARGDVGGDVEASGGGREAGEDVAHLAHRHDAVLAEVVLQLLAQVQDGVVHRAVARVPLAAEHLAGQLVAGPGLARRLGQGGERVELGRGQAHRRVVRAIDAAFGLHDPPAARLGDRGGRRGGRCRRGGAATRAAQMGAQPRHQLTARDRLEQEVVGAEFEPQHAVHFFLVAGVHEDRHVRHAAQARQQLERVDAAEALVEQHGLHRLFLQHLDRVLEGVGFHRAHAVAADVAGDLGGEAGLVIGHQHQRQAGIERGKHAGDDGLGRRGVRHRMQRNDPSIPQRLRFQMNQVLPLPPVPQPS